MESDNLLSRASISETKEEYDAPIVEIVEVKVEQGVQMYFSLPNPGNSPGDDPSF